jgi:hypothetical protein
MGSAADYVRASRYRRLAQVEKNKAIADLLGLLAREAEQGILFTADRLQQPTPPPRLRPPARKSNGPPTSTCESVFPW